jgi:hypothetical protein
LINTTTVLKYFIDDADPQFRVTPMDPSTQEKVPPVNMTGAVKLLPRSIPIKTKPNSFVATNGSSSPTFYSPGKVTPAESIRDGKASIENKQIEDELAYSFESDTPKKVSTYGGKPEPVNNEPAMQLEGTREATTHFNQITGDSNRQGDPIQESLVLSPAKVKRTPLKDFRRTISNRSQATEFIGQDKSNTLPQGCINVLSVVSQASLVSMGSSQILSKKIGLISINQELASANRELLTLAASHGCLTELYRASGNTLINGQETIKQSVLSCINFLPVDPASEDKESLDFYSATFDCLPSVYPLGVENGQGIVSMHFLRQHGPLFRKALQQKLKITVKVLGGVLLAELFLVDPTTLLDHAKKDKLAALYDELDMRIVSVSKGVSEVVQSKTIRFPDQGTLLFEQDELTYTVDQEKNEMVLLRFQIWAKQGSGSLLLIKDKPLLLPIIAPGFRSLYFEETCSSHFLLHFDCKEL